MTTLSVPLSPDQAKFVEETTKKTGATKADIMRQALQLYAEEMAVRNVLLASTEPTLEGDLDELASKLS